MAWRTSVYDYTDAKKIKDVIPIRFTRKLELSKEMKAFYQKTGKRDRYIRGVFFDFLKIMIEDLIENNHVFVTPNMVSYKIFIKEKHPTEQAIIRGNLGRKYKCIDPIASDGKSYEMILRSRDIPRLKYRKIRIGNSHYQQIIEKVNQGKRYFV